MWHISISDFTHLIKHIHIIVKLCHFAQIYRALHCRHNLNHIIVFLKYSLLCMLFDIHIFLAYFKATSKSVTLCCDLQYCHCAAHSPEIPSCLSFQIRDFYCIRSLWYSKSQQRQLPFRWYFSFCCYKSAMIKANMWESVYLLKYVGHSIVIEAKAWNWM